MGTVALKKDKIKKYICIARCLVSDSTHYQQENEECIVVERGEILECDEHGCIRKNGVSLCHKDSDLGRFYFRECDENGAIKKDKKKKRRKKKG